MINNKNITRIFEVSHHEIDGFSDLVLKELGYNQSANNPDVVIIKADQKEKIGIDQVKYLRTWSYIRPFQEKIKISIIERADLMTKEAQNSILKITEEPPSFLYIFLIVENHRNLLQTIVSRSEISVRKAEIESHKEEIVKLIDMPLIEKFSQMDKLSKKRAQEINTFLNKLIIDLEKLGLKDESAKILEYKANILSNVSKKLVLDNLALLLENIKKSKKY